MLNMSIEMFSAEMDELLEMRKKLIEQQKKIGCWEIEEAGPVLIYNPKRFLNFAKYKELPVEQEEAPEKDLRYKLSILYKGTKITSYATEKEFEQLKKDR